MSVPSIAVNYLKFKKLTPFLILIPIFFAVFLRILPLYLSGTDMVAENTVERIIKQNIAAEVYNNNPTLPDERKIRLIEKREAEFKQSNSETIKKRNAEVSSQLKERFRDDSSHPYLLEVDGYYYARLVRNLIAKGAIADEVRDGVLYNNHQLAPVGKLSEPNLNIQIGAFAFKLMRLFNPEIPLIFVLSYIPIILSVFAVVAAFFVGKMLKNDIAGFFSAMLVAIHPKLLERTFGGFFDTDPYNILMPLLIAVCFILLFQQFSFKRRFFFVLLIGFLSGLYSVLWSGWIFIFHVLMYSFIFAAGFHLFLFGYNRIKKREYHLPTVKAHVALFFSFLISSAISITLLDFLLGGKLRFLPLYNLYNGVFTFLSIKTGKLSPDMLWPNILSTVSELQLSSFGDIISGLGGFILFFVFVAGLAVLLINLFKKRRMTLLFFFLFWTLFTLYGTTKGMRFIFLFATPFSIIVGYAFAECIDFFAKIAVRTSKPRFVKYAIQLFVFGLCLTLLFFNLPLSPSLFTSALAVSRTLPFISDEWVSALDFIRENTNSTAIITSWWDFGHWFEFYADRPVTFDGASQHLPVSYWVGRFFLSNNETEAIGILRMLDCGSNSAFDNLFSWSGNFLQSIKILNKAVFMDRQKANEYYNSLFSKEQSGKLISLTHCTPPEAVVIASEDMVGKASAWGFSGSWNFTRAFLSRHAGKQEFIALAESAGVSSDTAAKTREWINTHSQKEINNWISTASLFNSKLPETCTESAGVLSCKSNILDGNINVLIDKQTLSAKILFKNYVLTPKRLVYFNNNITAINFENATFEYSLILFADSGQYKLQIASGNLADSLFVKLMYFNGAGSSYFKPFYSARAFNREAIKAYKITWPD